MNIQILYKELIEFEGILNYSISDLDLCIDELSFDSRVQPSSRSVLFIALKGEQFDAHDFISNATSLGIKAFVVSKKSIFEDLKNKGVDVILVRNTLRFTQVLAERHRSSFSIPVIAITGSNGKTICKEWIYELLKKEFRILRSPKSYNSQIGVALSLFELQDYYDLAIIEAGVSIPGEMRHLQKMIQPTFGLFTNNLEAHAKNFDNLGLKNIEKHVLFEGLEKFVENEKFSISEHKGMWLDKNVRIDKKDNFTEVAVNGLKFQLNFTEDFLIENAINTFLVAKEFTKDLDLLLLNMRTLRPIAMRWEQFEGANNNLLINDSYCLDFSSLKVSLQQLSSFSDNRNKVLVLAGLNVSHTEEKEVNTAIKTFGITDILCLNNNNGISDSIVFESEQLLIQFVNDNIHDSVILFKTSRNLSISAMIRDLKKKNHRTSLELDLTKMKSNLMFYRNKLESKTKLLVMVKAASYGAGLKEITSFLTENKVDYLGVAFTDEGLALRDTGVALPIMVMNPDETYFSKGVKAQLEPVIHSLDHLDRIINVLISENKTNYPVHIKFNTGMNRLGMAQDDIPYLIDTIKAQPEIRVKSIMSHFSNADDPSMDDFTNEQFRQFEVIGNELELGLGYNFDKHICNSNAALRFPQFHSDMIRLGIGLHGMAVSEPLLQMTMKLKSYIAQIRLVEKGSLIGYGNNYKVQQDVLVGVIPIGYADGITRNFGLNGGYVFVNNQQCKVLGVVCMDMLMIDLSSFYKNDIKIGEEVEFFGEHISIAEHAQFQNTISYEVISRLSERVSRVYLRD